MKPIANTIKLRAINQERIKDYLKGIEHATKNDIAEATKLSVATCTNVLKQLLESGEVLELDHQASTGGRPARRFQYNPNFGQIAIMYLRKESDTYTIFWQISNLLGEALHEEVTPVKEMTLSEVDQVIDDMFMNYSDIKVLSLGLPGVVKDGCLFMCDFERIQHTDIASHIQKRYDVKVIVENDMNATAYGYYKSHNTSDDSIAYIYFPLNHPCGSGIIINHKILRGHSNFAGELSFLPLNLSRSEQAGLQYVNSEFTDMILKMIQSINCIINPKTIVFSGEKITASLLSIIENKLRTLTTAIHQPQIAYEKDIHESYVKGLIALSMEQLKGEVDLIRRCGL